MKFSADTTPDAHSGCRPLAGKGFGTIFFGLFFLMGMLFTVFILGEALRQLAPWWWPETDCTILSSGVGDTGNDQHPYRALVPYSYEINGRIYESDRVFRSDGGTPSFDRARDRAGRYPTGSTSTCRVDPENPALSVLEPRIPWIALAVFFPLIFVVIGAIGLLATWRRTPGHDEGETESISQTAGRGRGSRFAIGLGILFMAVGGVLFIYLFMLPMVKLVQAASWSPISCTVERSTVRSWSTDDGTSYRADVLYEYEAAGRSWRSNRISFFPLVSNGHDGARAITSLYRSGTPTTCWVDPHHPSTSVLERSFRPWYLMGLIPLVFFFAGAAVTRWGLKQLHERAVTARPAPELEVDIEGPLVLEPQLGPVGKLFGMIFFALFWNGIVSVFVFQAFKAWQSGHPDWFLNIFLVPFVLVGLLVVVFAGSFALALANPRPHLTMQKANPCLGDELRIDWRFSGRASRIRHLRIILEGREEATYRRGTDTVTDREVFSTFSLVDTDWDWEIPRGTAALTIPDDTMHSFEAPNNKILWEIKVEGEITRWPDVEQNFPITIKPLRIEDL